MHILIIKLGATGDVVRTTPLLEKFTDRITWITAAKNLPLLEGLQDNLRCLSWEERHLAANQPYDMVINLEDTLESGRFAGGLKYGRLFGAFLEAGNRLTYTDDSRDWFDLSLISRFGKQAADRMKLENRRAYQDLIFSGLGFRFNGEMYRLPAPAWTDLAGDVAIAPEAGPVWPMKNWAYYDLLKEKLEARGLIVNVLPRRETLLEHLGDVRNHRCLVGGDSLPMHFALGTGRRCVTLFNCTSPWEIHDYSLQQKIVSPLLAEFFYQRSLDLRATTAISLENVLGAVMTQLEAPIASANFAK
ncbi:MAG TPA: glycosyltransferase family 9 protein [Verrucomicrobiae bacterium]|nr:glycosyltransferase family 9 protein [Verrucomicrobiae bacterium]